MMGHYTTVPLVVLVAVEVVVIVLLLLVAVHQLKIAPMELVMEMLEGVLLLLLVLAQAAVVLAWVEALQVEPITQVAMVVTGYPRGLIGLLQLLQVLADITLEVAAVG